MTKNTMGIKLSRKLVQKMSIVGEQIKPKSVIRISLIVISNDRY